MYEHPLYHWPPKSRWTQPMVEPQAWQSLGAYIHFPFCRNICDFCNYETRLINKSSVDAFSGYIVNEIVRYGQRDDFSQATITNLFFGGGTASLMPRSTMLATLDELKRLTGQERIEE